MSLKALAFAWDYVAEGPIQKFVLVALADQAQDCGHLWPSVASIAERMGVADSRTIRRHITALVEQGIVVRLKHFGSSGRQTANIYELAGMPGRKGCSELCRVFELRGGAQMSGSEGGEMSGGEGAQMSGSSMNRKPEPKKTTSKKTATKWVNDTAFDWPSLLIDLPQVHADHPSEQWIKEKAQHYRPEMMRVETQKFVDYYNAPDTRKLKGWKTAFTTWLQRAARDLPEPTTDVMHDTSLPRGECRCRMCERRRATG